MKLFFCFGFFFLFISCLTIPKFPEKIIVNIEQTPGSISKDSYNTNYLSLSNQNNNYDPSKRFVIVGTIKLTPTSGNYGIIAQDLLTGRFYFFSSYGGITAVVEP